MGRTVAGEANKERADRVIATKDGGYAACITIDHANPSDASPSDPSDIRVLKVAADGGLTWNKKLPRAGGQRCSAMIEANDGGLVVADELILKLNATGEVLWENGLNWGWYDHYANSLVANPSGTVTAGGDHVSIDPKRMNPWIAEFDAAGNILWKTEYLERVRSMSLGSLSPVPGGSTHYMAAMFDVGASSWIRNTNVYKTLWLTKFDTRGSAVWEKSVDLLDGTHYPPGRYQESIATKDGGFLTLIYLKARGSEVETQWLFKVSESGDLQWKRPYSQ